MNVKPKKGTLTDVSGVVVQKIPTVPPKPVNETYAFKRAEMLAQGAGVSIDPKTGKRYYFRRKAGEK